MCPPDPQPTPQQPQQQSHRFLGGQQPGQQPGQGTLLPPAPARVVKDPKAAPPQVRLIYALFLWVVPLELLHQVLGAVMAYLDRDTLLKSVEQGFNAGQGANTDAVAALSPEAMSAAVISGIIFAGLLVVLVAIVGRLGAGRLLRGRSGGRRVTQLVSFFLLFRVFLLGGPEGAPTALIIANGLLVIALGAIGGMSWYLTNQPAVREYADQ